MHVSNFRKTQARADEQSSGARIRLRAVARKSGIPEFMHRFARMQRIRIVHDRFIPSYRHD